MKMIHLSKLLKIFVLLIVITTIMSNCVVMAYNIKSAFGGSTTSTIHTPVQTVIGTVLDVVRTVGIGIALVILMYIGVKFMLAAPSERANIKEYSMNYIIGAFILIGAVGIVSIIGEFAQNVTTVTTPG